MPNYTRHTFVSDIDLPLSVKVDYRRYPGSPQEGASYSSGGTPASPPEIDGTVVWVVIAGRLLRIDGIVAEAIVEHCRDDLEWAAREEVDALRDEAADRRADDREAA